jgi:hypothetical protein
MSVAGLISGKNISGLEHNQFRRVLNTLLIVEVNVIGPEPTKLSAPPSAAGGETRLT